MTRTEIARALREEYARVRDENARETERRQQEVISLAPQARELIFGGADLFAAKARLAMSDPDRAEALAGELKDAGKARSDALRGLLKGLGKEENYLDPIYRCAACKDTGLVGDVVKRECPCFTRRVSERLFEEASGVPGERFASFDGNIFPDDEPVSGSLTQKGQALAVRDLCARYVEDYPGNVRRGLLIMGGTGLGKTFLLNCIHNALIEKGVSPVRVTAWRLYEAMRRERFGGGETDSDFRQMIGCDVLLIDDLGTEPMTQGVTREYLFTLLNERLTSLRHTVIATNMKSRDLLTVYGERVFSRLADTANVAAVVLAGKDLRLYGRGKAR